MTRIYVGGKIEVKDHGEASDVVFVSDDNQPLAERLEGITNKPVTVRYWTTREETSLEQAQTDAVKTLLGAAEVQFQAHYSEITGYLWTDEDLVIGGHDLLDELRSQKGEWLHLEIIVHEEIK